MISLPAGVFNPYSGVKTSILWIDRVLAKKSDKILFVKVESDGLDLGAQRTPVETNDLAGDLIMSCSGTVGKVAMVPQGIRPGIINQALLRLTPKPGLMARYLKLWMESTNSQSDLNSLTYGSAIKSVASVDVLKTLQIPIPEASTQTEIVAQVDKEQELNKANQELISLFEKKIAHRISRIWSWQEGQLCVHPENRLAS